jgi:hypothetical protein
MKSLIVDAKTGSRIRKTEQSDKLIGRIYNWKFKSALKYMKGQRIDIQDLIRTLATLFGNEGWMDGLVADLVKTAEQYLLGDDLEEERKIH